MIAIIKKDADRSSVDNLVSWIEKKGLQAHVSQGENELIIGLVGDTTKIDPFLLESMDIVERVQRVSEPFKKANRKFHPRPRPRCDLRSRRQDRRQPTSKSSQGRARWRVRTSSASRAG